MPIDSIPNYAVFPGQLGKEDHINSRFFTGKLRRKEKQFTIHLFFVVTRLSGRDAYYFNTIPTL
jgi:hypothetical protein